MARAYRATRRQNWIAIAVATVVMLFSYFSYAAAFVDSEGNTDSFDPKMAALGLAVAPFVFIILGFVSRNARAPTGVMWAMLLLLCVGLPIGLIDPLLGAATGFAAGAAASLRRPQVPRIVWWRVGAVVFTMLYCLALLVLAGPAGVFTGGIVPLLMVGFADEYAVWVAERDDRTPIEI